MLQKQTRHVTMRERREWLLFALLIGPNLFLFGVFTYWPLLYNFYLSFVSWNFLRPRKRFVWFENYLDVFSQPQFWTIVWNTVIFALFSVGLTLLIGLALALLLNQPLRYRNGARAVLFSPVIMSGAVVAVVWSYIFDPRYGLIDQLLGLIGLNSPNWLGDPAWAMPAVIMVYVWKNLGYAVVIYLAGLQGIPRELYDAARVDGAGPWDRFWHVTLPGLSPVAFFLSVTSILATFQAFDIIKVLTNGGPVIATTTLIFHLYDLGFVSYNAGEAGVIAIVLFAIMLILTIIQLRYLEQRVAYS
ncbi:sugar ABC transporter permease [Candidatus Chloroploca sp. M-50]|uniref:Sugar ABC transporter permease n=1 Tax=Candidatus Chloroploca mongolica TaxID=2528176 RepID=A0ABS4D6D2_9CHLR|nr:sugar ABC transporter permease [Candidatus Chloroploca mongolica]MBP1464998.1 sugar ABC transporter permease [Candidatus Chloroploca mongolica]